MDYSIQFQKLCQIEGRRYILIVSVVAITYLMLQTFMLPYGTVLKSLLPSNDALLSVRSGFAANQLSAKSAKGDEIDSSNLLGVVEHDDQSKGDGFIESDSVSNEGVNRIEQDIALEGKRQDDPLILDTLSSLNMVDFIRENRSTVESDNVGNSDQMARPQHQILKDSSLDLNSSSSFVTNEQVEDLNKEHLVQPETVRKVPDNDLPILRTDSKVMGMRQKKKVRPGMPPFSVTPIDKMNRILARHLAASIKMKPQWSSMHDRDKDVIDAKFKIINSAVSDVDKELYAPLFRNFSLFMRSYELMEKTLKVYVYKDGKKPIFHQPILKGLYASEGWFMKLMEGNKHFVVKNPEKAHLFYMPFSSRMLEYELYEPSSHNRTKLRDFIKNYTEAIAAKYPFWNRTGGTDHFVVACHDWAPYETRHHMENSIKALCNADVTIGFKIGRDVSLPETFVRYARNPLRDIGGKPPLNRNILAFYAGNSHGYLRPILLKYWKDKDPDMRIYGLLPTRLSRRMNYIQHMKSSKYCICPKGHEVNSPRVVEAIFYDCVPVIISDNFVPPFFEVLNWEAFSIIVAEKDIPNLKDILVSIPEEKYIEMQFAVRMVQRHFLWHARPMKYDLFHMTLHSIWYSRVFQIRKQ